jgi:hypothetical protein
MSRDLSSATDELRSTLERYDEATARELFDRFTAWFGLDVVALKVVPLLLRAVEMRTRSAKLSPTQQCFIRGAITELLLRRARGWARGDGPRAVLASTSDPEHEASLIGFGLALRRRGWRICYLGIDTPIAILLGSVRALQPRLVVVSLPKAPGSVAPELRDLAELAPLALLGSSPAFAGALGARVFGDDLLAEARRVSHGAPGASLS